MPSEEDRIIAEDAFNKRLSGVRKGRPTSEASTSFMGRKSPRPNVEEMLGVAKKDDMPIIKESEDNGAHPPLAPDIQEQLKALAQMPTRQAPVKPQPQTLPTNAPQNPLRPAVLGKPELLGQGQQFEGQTQSIPDNIQPQALTSQPQTFENQQGPVPGQNHGQEQILNPQRQAQQDKIERTYFFDQQIPAIFNFRHSMNLLAKEVKRANRHGRPLSICILTFHELPMIKSSYGDLAIEAALQNLGKILAHYVDLDMEVAGRYGDNQIVVVLPEMMAPNAAQLMDEIRRTLESAVIQFRQYQFSLIASIGVASFPAHGNDWKELLVKAEQASEQAIERGGNTIAFPPRA